MRTNRGDCRALPSSKGQPAKPYRGGAPVRGRGPGPTAGPSSVPERLGRRPWVRTVVLAVRGGGAVGPRLGRGAAPGTSGQGCVYHIDGPKYRKLQYRRLTKLYQGPADAQRLNEPPKRSKAGVSCGTVGKEHRVGPSGRAWGHGVHVGRAAGDCHVPPETWRHVRRAVEIATCGSMIPHG